MNAQKIIKRILKKLENFIEAFFNQQILLAFMDQSYFQNTPNVARILFKPKTKNIFYRTGEKFGISATGIMGVNCSSLIEFYK